MADHHLEMADSYRRAIWQPWREPLGESDPPE